MRRALLICPLMISVTACYRYTPAPLDSIVAGTEVRARITAEEAQRWRDVLSGEDRLLEGVLLSHDSAFVLIEVPALHRAAGSRVETFNQRLNIARPGLLEIELKRLDRPRTYAVVAAGVLIGGKLAYDALKGKSGSETPPRNGGPPDIIRR